MSLDPEQKRDLRAWLTRTLEWHRASELGRYAEFLHGLTNQIAAPGDRASYERVEKQIEAFGDAVVAQATPEAARMLLKLSDAQLDELDRNLDERSIERAEEDQEDDRQRRVAQGARTGPAPPVEALDGQRD